MANVYVSDLRVPRTPRNHRHYDGVGGSLFSSTTVTGGVTAPPVVLTPKDVIEFTATALPTITWAATHGQYPEVRCIVVVDSTTEYELQQKPQFTKVDGLIDTIFFDIGEEMTGYIILY
jgi:hypothetical protein